MGGAHYHSEALCFHELLSSSSFPLLDRKGLESQSVNTPLLKKHDTCFRGRFSRVPALAGSISG